MQARQEEAAEVDGAVDEQGEGEHEDFVGGQGGREVGRHEGEPHQQGGVDAERDVARLVVVVGQAASLEGQHGADQDEQDVVSQGGHHATDGQVAQPLHDLLRQHCLAQLSGWGFEYCGHRHGRYLKR